MQEKYPLILMLMLILPSMSILVLFDGDDDVCVDVSACCVEADAPMHLSHTARLIAFRRLFTHFLRQCMCGYKCRDKLYTFRVNIIADFVRLFEKLVRVNRSRHRDRTSYASF